MKTTTGKRIQHLRKILNLTLIEFAEKIEVSFGTVSGWERTGKGPKKPTLRAIAGAFNVNIEWLETGEGPVFKDGAAPVLSAPESSTGGNDAPAAIRPPDDGGEDRRDDERQEQDDDGEAVDAIQRVFDLLTVDQQNAVVKAITIYLEKKADEARKRLERLDAKTKEG